ncbi:hypothetical protein CCR75_003166 [Bremia lactucae]|uniref:Uncharacterized protein n=1 Tax=Bremia lactucae TaxID=4779 RepID=A0A976IHP3_BRELC|nr:hypothetical protein CCR75_003166 [Bremia lactucae]
MKAGCALLMLCETLFITTIIAQEDQEKLRTSRGLSTGNSSGTKERKYDFNHYGDIDQVAFESDGTLGDSIFAATDTDTGATEPEEPATLSPALKKAAGIDKGPVIKPPTDETELPVASIFPSPATPVGDPIAVKKGIGWTPDSPSDSPATPAPTPAQSDDTETVSASKIGSEPFSESTQNDSSQNGEQPTANEKHEWTDPSQTTSPQANSPTTDDIKEEQATDAPQPADPPQSTGTSDKSQSTTFWTPPSDQANNQQATLNASSEAPQAPQADQNADWESQWNNKTEASASNGHNSHWQGSWRETPQAQPQSTPSQESDTNPPSPSVSLSPVAKPSSSSKCSVRRVRR